MLTWTARRTGTLSNYDTIAALAKQGGLYIEVGGGIRTEERIETYLALGVGRWTNMHHAFWIWDLAE